MKQQNNSMDEVLKNLVNSTLSHKYLLTFKNYRKAYDYGKDLVPKIRDRMLRIDWSKIHTRGKIEYLTILMLLLHDIDETESKRLKKDILTKNKKCNMAVITRVNSICSFTLNDFIKFSFFNIPIFISKDLKNFEGIGKKIKQWIGNVKEDGIDGINRIYVIEKKQEEYLGHHIHILDVIMIVWTKPLYSIEYTFYHEVGHFLDPNFMDKKEQRELTADIYARRIFCKVHPYLCKTLIKYLVIPFIFRKIKLKALKLLLKEKNKFRLSLISFLMMILEVETAIN